MQLYNNCKQIIIIVIRITPWNMCVRLNQIFECILICVNKKSERKNTPSVFILSIYIPCGLPKLSGQSRVITLICFSLRTVLKTKWVWMFVSYVIPVSTSMEMSQILNQGNRNWKLEMRLRTKDGGDRTLAWKVEYQLQIMFLPFSFPRHCSPLRSQGLKPAKVIQNKWL
jgi:hypothetical protein